VDRMLRQGAAKQRALDALTERLTHLEQLVEEMLPKASMPGPFPGMMPGLAGMSPMLAQAQMGQQRDQPVQKRNAKKDGEPPTEEEVRNRFLQATRAGLANKSGDAASTSFNAEAPVFVPRGASSPTDETGGVTPAKAAAASISSAAKADATEGSTTEPTDLAEAVTTGNADIGDGNMGGDIAPGLGEDKESTSGTVLAAAEYVVPSVPSEAPPPPPGISLVATEAPAGEEGTPQTENTDAAESTL